MISSLPSVSWSLFVRVMTCMLLLMTYVLSVGPAIWLINRGYIPSGALQTLELIYAPLELLSRIPLFGPVLEQYAYRWS